MKFNAAYTFGACAFALAFSAAANASTIAITEFMRDPAGTDTEEEYIELFNYGAEPVNLEGWTLKDNASTVRTLPDVVIPSGGYIISVFNKPLFEETWLGGAEDSRVVAGDNTFQLNQGGDGLYLNDQSDNQIWTLGYTITPDNANGSYRATFLAVDDFTQTNYGYPPQDGPALINFNGLDGTMMGETPTLGYESNDGITPDPFAFPSSARNVDGIPYEFGSPLAGGYTAVPEPASAALLLMGAAGLIRRRAR